MNTKKFLLTFLDIIIVTVACYWCFWLVFYFSATVDGSIFITNAYALFGRNYLVPAQSFGIPVVFTVLSVFFYCNLRKKELIGKKYIILVLFNIIPLWVISIFQIINLIDYHNIIY